MGCGEDRLLMQDIDCKSTVLIRLSRELVMQL